MPDSSLHTTALAALNHWRGVDDLSYSLLRAHVEPFRKNVEGNWLTRRALSQLGRYRIFSATKELGADGVAEYRTMVGAAPVTALGEASALALLARASGFEVPSYVYSHRWPARPSDGRIYARYLPHYLARNRATTEMLSRRSGHVALVLDIRNYYPSVDPVRAQTRLRRRLELAQLLPSERTFIDQVLNAYVIGCVEVGEGLTIGPAASHLLARCDFEDVDADLATRFPSAYTRYVDDIVVTVPRERADASMRYIEARLNDSGFAMHERKRDVTSLETWRQHAPHPPERELGPRSFERLMLRLKCYAERHPEALDHIARQFVDRGFRVPFESLRVAERRPGWVAYLRYVSLSHPRLALMMARDNAGSLEGAAFQLRTDLERALPDILRECRRTGDGPTILRWRTTRIRRFLLQCAFFVHDEPLATLVSECLTLDGLREMALAVRAGLNGDLSALARLPGAPVGLACMLLSARGASARIDWEQTAQRQASIDAAYSIVARGHAAPPVDWVESVENEHDRALLRRFIGAAEQRRQLRDFSYHDEGDSLLIGARRADVVRWTTSRLDSDDDDPLEALQSLLS